MTTVDTCRPTHVAKKPFLQVTVQPLEQMLPFDVAAAANIYHADVFVFNDEFPEILDLERCSPSDRPKYRQRQSQPSQIEGCTSLLVNPTTLSPPADMSLFDNRMPALCLLDALRERGWTGKAQLAKHTSDSDLIFDDRRPTNRKSYFKCLLISQELFAGGISEFPSINPNTYYDYMIKFRRCPPATDSMKQLRAAILGDAGTGDVIDQPLIPIMYAAPFPAAPDPEPLDDDIAIDVDEGIDIPPRGPSTPVPEPESPAPVDVPTEPPAAELEHDDSEIVTDEGPAIRFADGLGDWPTELEGVKVTKIAGRAGTKFNHTRLAVTCPCCHTTRSRSTAVLVGELGDNAVLAFLGAWLKARHSQTPEEHAAHKPGVVEQRAYRDRWLS